VREVREHLRAALRVDDLGMEEQPPDRQLAMPHRREGRALAAAEHAKAVRQAQHAVTVAHPHDALRAARDALEEGILALELQQRAPVLAILAALDHAAEPQGQDLHAVADAEDRDTEAGQRGIEVRRVRIERARGAAREHDARRVPRPDRVERERRRMDLAVDALLAQPSRDELRELRAVVEDQDAIARGHRR
jgi:hypothetical protein